MLLADCPDATKDVAESMFIVCLCVGVIAAGMMRCYDEIRRGAVHHMPVRPGWWAREYEAWRRFRRQRKRR